MGSVDSTKLGKRTSFLVTALAMGKAAYEFEQRLHRCTVPKHIDIWAHKRREHKNTAQLTPLLLLVFKEDMTDPAVRQIEDAIIEQFEHDFIRGTFDVEFSTKPDATLTFATIFDFIGAECETSYYQIIKRRMARHVREALQEDFARVRTKRGTLVDRATLERTTRRLTFCARFLHYGGGRLNYTYDTLPSA